MDVDILDGFKYKRLHLTRRTRFLFTQSHSELWKQLSFSFNSFVQRSESCSSIHASRSHLIFLSLAQVPFNDQIYQAGPYTQTKTTS